MDEIEELKKRAEDLDARRRLQIASQRDTITRLLEDSPGETEIARLHEELAQAQARIAELEGEGS